MNAREIVKALRWLAKETEFVFAAEQLNDAAALIEQRQSELAELREETTSIPLPRLRETCEEEQEGRCAVLPCKPSEVLTMNDEFKNELIMKFRFSDLFNAAICARAEAAKGEKR